MAIKDVRIISFGQRNMADSTNKNVQNTFIFSPVAQQGSVLPDTHSFTIKAKTLAPKLASQPNLTALIEHGPFTTFSVDSRDGQYNNISNLKDRAHELQQQSNKLAEKSILEESWELANKKLNSLYQDQDYKKVHDQGFVGSILRQPDFQYRQRDGNGKQPLFWVELALKRSKNDITDDDKIPLHPEHSIADIPTSMSDVPLVPWKSILKRWEFKQIHLTNLDPKRSYIHPMTIDERRELLINAYNFRNPYCEFQYAFYDLPKLVDKEITNVRPYDIHPALWRMASSSNPNPRTLVPAFIRGHDDLQKRAYKATKDAQEISRIAHSVIEESSNLQASLNRTETIKKIKLKNVEQQTRLLKILRNLDESKEQSWKSATGNGLLYKRISDLKTTIKKAVVDIENWSLAQTSIFPKKTWQKYMGNSVPAYLTIMNVRIPCSAVLGEETTLRECWDKLVEAGVQSYFYAPIDESKKHAILIPQNADPQIDLRVETLHHATHEIILEHDKWELVLLEMCKINYKTPFDPSELGEEHIRHILKLLTKSQQAIENTNKQYQENLQKLQLKAGSTLQDLQKSFSSFSM